MPKRIGAQLGIPSDTLRGWVERAEIDQGVTPGTTTDDKARLVELEREVRELRRANAISKSASAFFAAELDGPPADDPLHRREQSRLWGRADVQGTADRPADALRAEDRPDVGESGP